MENIIHTFKGSNLFETTTELFKHLNISTQTFEEQAFLPQDFLKDLYKPQKHKAINEIYLVGIVTDEVFNGKSLAEVDNELSNDYQGLLIIAVDLKDKIANRTELSTLTRLFNRRFNAMPVAVLFRYGNHIALANAERTQYKQTYREGEKIGKVSILKDIDTLKPHRGHLRILEKLQIDKSIKTFKELYAKWLGVFDTKILNKEFYKELFAWYEWAISETSGIKYPNDPKAIKEERQLEKQIIRLITRVLFVWFIKQKGLVPNNLFEEAELQKILKDFQANSSENGNYYNAILQNLFFATLNKEITERAFAKEKNGRDVKTLYRYAEMFSISEEKVIELFKPVPFLNGGLFECLDKDQGNDGKRYHLDGFSRNENTKEDGNRFRQRTLIPNIFFFEKDKGLFSILNKYYFTVEENTPEEVQVALDPELLGNVFENLLGAFNPETEKLVRNESGSFYTPKEVVNYMVDESLRAYLKNHLPSFPSKLIDELFEGQDLTTDFDDITKRKQVAECLRKVKILDPACGSGAFPMGLLNTMVYILQKLGVDINETTYQLKRHLIEKCIYGVDIQTTATQISKLRFFISLILEQSETNTDPALNYGIQPLPNLETKFVTANTLIDIREKKVEVQGDLFESSITTIKEELIKIREAHFEASSPYKKKVLREQDKILREKLIKKLKEFGEATPDNAKQFAEWDPYDQNASASFFDPEWMFGVSDGFDIVIGNPPYIKEDENRKAFDGFRKTSYYKGKMDIWYGFACKGIDLLKQKGTISFIAQNNWVTSSGASILRNKILEETELEVFIDFVDYKVFESASIQTMIFLLQKVEKPHEEYYAKVSILKDKDITDSQLRDFLKFGLENNYSTKKIFKLKPKKYIGKAIHFNQSDIENILEKIEEKGAFKLYDKEVAQGIIAPQDFVNESSAKILGINVRKGDGIFVISDKELTNLNLSEKEYELIKPYYTSDELDKYYTNKKNSYWIIYTNSDFKNIEKIKAYPKIKEHLDKFKEVITSSNKPYGLHRSREEKFFKDEKILSLRKCKEPTFTFSDFDCYVSQTYFIIQTNRLNLKYLTAYLNSKVIKFWLRFKGKMQGKKYQIDKEPLLSIPIIKPKFESHIIRLFSDIPNNENNINSIFYEIFNLTKDEINIIESHL